MNKALFASLLLMLTLQCHSQSNVIIGKCNEIVYPVTPNETNDFTELFPLEKLFKEKNVLGMGESTHGSKEFFNMKAKMFKFLATHCGYRIFTIEAPFGGTLKTNDYVLYGKGDVLSAMKGMEFWTCDTEEVKDLIEWMRKFNNGKPDHEKLKFYGFDCQSFKGPNNALVDYIKEYDNHNLNEFLKGLSVLNDSSYRYFYTIKPDKSSKQQITQIRRIISFLENWFKENEVLYISSSGKTKFELALHNIEAIKQALRLRESPEQKYGFLRDSCMAQNLKWIYELEQAKVFVSAHNGHIGKAPNPFEKHEICMGMFLDTFFGDRYYNVGLAFKQGSFQAFSKDEEKLREFSVPEYKKNSLTNKLSVAGINAFFLDLTTTNNKIFTKSMKAYYVGGGFIQAYWYKYSKEIIAKKQFDGLIYIDKTSGVRPIARN